MMAVRRNRRELRTNLVFTGRASARSSSCVQSSSCTPLYARPMRPYQSVCLPLLIGVSGATHWCVRSYSLAFPVLRCVSPPISHAIPPPVFHDLNCDRWNSKVYGALFKWVLGELHAEFGRGALISPHKGTVLRGKLRIPWPVIYQPPAVARSRGWHTLGL